MRRAQIAVRERAVLHADILLGDVDERRAGVAVGAEAGANVRALVLQQALGDVPAAVARRPTSWSFGTFTSVKKVSQNGDEPEISLIGRVSTPGVVMSISTNEMPSCFFVKSVRTRQKHQSA